jgi:hypothetical protein
MQIKKMVPLQGEEIGQLIAHALGHRVTQRRPWYKPSDKLPDEPIISFYLRGGLTKA